MSTWHFHVIFFVALNSGRQKSSLTFLILVKFPYWIFHCVLVSLLCLIFESIFLWWLWKCIRHPKGLRSFWAYFSRVFIHLFRIGDKLLVLFLVCLLGFLVLFSKLVFQQSLHVVYLYITSRTPYWYVDITQGYLFFHFLVLIGSNDQYRKVQVHSQTIIIFGHNYVFWFPGNVLFYSHPWEWRELISVIYHLFPYIRPWSGWGFLRSASGLTISPKTAHFFIPWINAWGY